MDTNEIRKACRNPRPITLLNGARGMIRCYSRDPRACLFCADIHRMETKLLIGSGCNTSEQFAIDAATVDEFNYFWDTLTAPSFGRVHSVPSKRDDKSHPCACGEWHSPTDALKGVPIGRYDRKGQVEWNMKSRDLIVASFKRYKENLPGVEWAIVREYQARGALHIHYMLRVPKTVPVEEVFRMMRVVPTTVCYGITWGKRLVPPEQLTHEGREGGVRYMAKVVGYQAKAQGLYDRVSPERMRHYDLLSRHAERMPHRKTCDPATCLSTSHRNLGFSGHILSLSSGWSFVGLSRKVLAERRREWVRENIHEKEDAA